MIEDNEEVGKIVLDSKYFTISILDATPLARVFEVKSKSDKFRLGLINYYKYWRQYVFAPSSQTIFNFDCMEEITNFLKKLKEEKK